MRNHRQTAGIAALASLVLVSGALAADQPISGKALRLKAASGGALLSFASRDPAMPFPAFGSVDDPSAGSSGIVVEVFSAGESADTLAAGPGVGNPGWKLGAGPVPSYRYRNHVGSGVSPLKTVVLKQTRTLKVHGFAGMTLAGSLGEVVIRVTNGTQRSCAYFASGSVRRDQAGVFLARGAPAPAWPDCSEETILGALGFDCATGISPICGGSCPGTGLCVPDPLGGPCHCAFPTQSCGTTAPACNGECPTGEQCYEIDDFLPGSVNACLCAPVGDPPCGTTGTTCGGACPAGLECNLIPGSGIFESACACTEPSPGCGPGLGSCPPDTQCLPVSPFEFSCLPELCGDGSFPSCGGSCSGGKVCVPLDMGPVEFCVCAEPTGSCDEPACDSGLFCPAGGACTGSSGACSCEPL